MWPPRAGPHARGRPPRETVPAPPRRLGTDLHQWCDGALRSGSYRAKVHVARATTRAEARAGRARRRAPAAIFASRTAAPRPDRRDQERVPIRSSERRPSRVGRVPLTIVLACRSAEPCPSRLTDQRVFGDRGRATLLV